MSDLTEFLLARIAADEAVARGAGSRQTNSGPIVYEWSAREYPYGGIGILPYPENELETTSTEERTGQTEHITRWSPARVLAECEAKRAYIERVGRKMEVDAGNELAQLAYLLAVKAMALPYADHPDYRDEWRP